MKTFAVGPPVGLPPDIYRQVLVQVLFLWSLVSIAVWCFGPVVFNSRFAFRDEEARLQQFLTWYLMERHETPPVSAQIHRTASYYIVLYRTVPQAMPETWQQILTYMQQHPGPQRLQDIHRALGRREPVRHVMHRMVERGLLRRVTPGVYVLADTVREEGEACVYWEALAVSHNRNT
jgi:hypothetical protein